MTLNYNKKWHALITPSIISRTSQFNNYFIDVLEV